MNSKNELLDDLTQISQKRTAINAITNYGQYAVNIIVGIILQRYLILALGKDEYSIWPLIFTCISVIALIPVGIGSGAARFMAHSLGRKDVQEVERITTSLFVALLAGALVYTIFVILLSVYFEQLFDIPAGVKGIGGWAMLLAGLGGAVALPFGVFQGGLRAAQKFTVLNIVSIIYLLLQLTLVIILFNFGLKSLIWVAAINLVLTIGSGTAVFIAAKKIVPWQRIRWNSFNWATLKKVNNFSLMILVSTVAGILYWKTDNIIINKLLDPSLLTGYAVVANFILYTYRITTVSVDVLQPVATIMHAKGEYSRIADLIYRVNRNIVPVAVCILIFLMVFGREVLQVYLEPSYSEFAILFTILGIGSIFSVVQNLPVVVPQAFGKMGLVSFVTLSTSVLNVLLSLLFVIVFKWGLIGIAAGTAIVTIANKIIFWPYYTASLLQVSLRKYFYKSFLFPLFNCIPFVISVLIFKWIGLGNNLLELVAVFSISGIIEFIYMLIYGLHGTDRVETKKIIIKILKLIAR